MKLRILTSSILFLIAFSLKAQLFINEVSQGTGNKEYVELIVAGTPTCGDSTVNLQGWILDDNCGFFGSNGIAGGHIRFTTDPQWANIKYGTIITIYRGDDIFPGILPDETDANNDDVFVLPSSSNFFEKQITVPVGGSSSAITTYGTTGYTNGGGSWVMLGMANGGDAFQTVSPNDLTAAFHSVGWGTSISGTGIYFVGSASGLSFTNENLIDNDPRNQANWVSINALTAGSPSNTNNIANNTWRSSLLTQASSAGNVNINNTSAICFGDSAFLENNWQTASGIYFDTILSLSSTGCDTVIITNLAVSNTPNSSSTSICTNNPANVSNTLDTLMNINGCDSFYRTINTVLITAFYVNSNDICTNDMAFAGIDTVLSQQSVGGCDSAFIITETVFNTLVEISLGDTSICEGEPVNLFGQFETESAIYYSDTLTNVFGCDSAIQSFELIVNSLPIIFAGTDQSIIAGNQATISAEGAETYLWNTTETTETINVSPLETTSYTVTSTDLNNCSNSDSIIITVIVEDVTLLIPNAFTPNNDGNNDIFRIANEYAFEEIILRVYNRWGALVFQSNQELFGWDGFYKDSEQANDQYVYYIEAKEKVSQKYISISGPITLIR